MRRGKTIRRGKKFRRNMKTINLEPKWSGLVRYFIRILEDRSVKEAAKVAIRAELMRLAEFADKVNAQLRSKK